MFKTAFQGLILHVHVAHDLTRKKYNRIFDFRFRSWDTANFLSYGETWIMHTTPNQHLLTLPSSPVGKSSDLHAGVQQFKSHSGHKFFFFCIHTPL